MLQENPDLAEMYLTGKGKTQKSILDQLSGFESQSLLAQVKGILAPGRPVDKIKVVDINNGMPISGPELAGIAEDFNSLSEFIDYIKQNYAPKEV
jgi:hypothetical protein